MLGDDVYVPIDFSDPNGWTKAVQQRQQILISQGQKPDMPDYAPGGVNGPAPWYSDPWKLALAGLGAYFVLTLLKKG